MSKLTNLRQSAAMTQKELAGKSGVNIRSIQAYESGSRDINGASAIVVYKLAKALGVTIGELLDLQ